jgi:uncharacterized protein YecT (DUF1311 family)
LSDASIRSPGDASSIVICSDAELRQQAIDRNKLFDAARAKLSPEAYKALTVDQAQWIKGYTARCGISIADPPPPMPIPQTVIDCYRRESRARTAYLAGYLSEPNPTAPLPPPASALPPASPAPAATTCADPAPHDDRCSPEDLNVGAIAHVRRIGGARGCFSIEDFINKNGSGCRTVYPYESLTVKDIQGDYDVVASPPSGFANPLDVVYVIYSDLARGPPLASKPPEPSKPVEAAPVVPTAPANADSAPWLKYQTPSARDEIALVEANGVYKVPVVINGVLPLQFVLDSGAADVSLPADVFSTLRRTGTISDADYIGRGSSDGSSDRSAAARAPPMPSADQLYMPT